ncbi:MAG: sulfurtransferase [Gammaproteobacteria bacterium HGW-Gammaproteobacteria-1]|jgi:rhodanese-related sulfurtransferase|nr:MAG: sulfurtransferase [Gammaproteobacteria bacterium HGW-Gammaproteobacteria-1]
MKHYTDLVAECLSEVDELFPWDLEEKLRDTPDLLLVDVREPYEFAAMHIEGALNVPRGVLESACEWDYEETVPELAAGRQREIVVICRSGYRSVLAAHTMQRMGYKHVYSLKTGMRGWFEFEQPMVDAAKQPVDEDTGEDYFTTRLRPEQRKPA